MSAPYSTDGDVIVRVKAEYLEMPGLKLTPAQAQRLWNLNRAACEGVLGRLVEDKFLQRTRDGSFIRFGSGAASH